MNLAVPPDRAVPVDALKRRVYTVAIIAGLIATALPAVLQGPERLATPPGGSSPAFSLAACAALLLLVNIHRVPLRLIERTLLVIATSAFALQVLHAVRHAAPPDATLHFAVISLSVTAFVTLRARHAALYAAALYTAVLVALAAHPPGNLTLPMQTGGILTLVATLGVYSERLARTRAEARTLWDLAHTDPLTGLHNRRAVYPHLDAHLTGSAPCALLLLDLDHFKRVNDEYGHHTGDLALQHVARVLADHVRPQDVVARWGGEEFLILLPGMNAADAADAAHRLCRAVRDARADDVPPLTISIGVALAAPGDTPTTWTCRADTHLYRAKQNGRDRAEVERHPHLRVS
ncbi:GGDEF domain-containing protein [Deinococcus maricopensis]|uniref:Diguanylate cyclase n=1 Tax=Deinococcus maricopensis (strain DSM 21211 / LMG 22137 / NRRL B-23946 / LB-34) TaxID=709986 RepID=E8UBT3_DEIML|nr:GGDEF domain-containing protein [Deinococcus maricopensis]ADV68522.1 diguanylate cyclase [Deinococcus maricopensis DSM 21211]